MAKERLILVENRHLYRICWYFPDDDEEGAVLGDYLHGGTYTPDSEHKIATEAVKATAKLDFDGLFWESKAKAQAALAAAKAAIKAAQSSKPWPDWAVKAAAAGWKAPKGWQP